MFAPLYCAALLLLTQPVREKIAAGIAKGERRAQERSAMPRPQCARCHRPSVQCVCHVLPKHLLPTQHDILILQHPAEFRRKTISTVPLLRLVLANVHVVVGKEDFDPMAIPLLRSVLDRGDKPLLMFPGDDAISLDDDDQEKEDVLVPQVPQSGRPLLVLLDGTWSQAKRMFRRSPKLVECCQQVQFTSIQNPSLYGAIRREPSVACLSTLEVCAKALHVLEQSTTTQHHLQHALASLVQVQLNHAEEGTPRFHGTNQKQQRRIQLEMELFGVATLHGAVLRRLQLADAPLVHSVWRDKELTMIQEQIVQEPCCCLGIESSDDHQLVAFCLRYRDGSLGMLYVKEAYRGRRYGYVLVQTITHMLQGQDCCAHILDGNTPSQAVFTQAGYRPLDPMGKRGTGRRRAVRKWVFDGEQQPS